MIINEQTKALAADMIEYWRLFNKHNQGSWIGSRVAESNLVQTKEVDGKEHNVCGTTLCAAGLAVFLSIPVDEFNLLAQWNGSIRNRLSPEDLQKVLSFSWSDAGGELLGLNSEESGALFYMMENERAKEAIQAIADGDEAAFWEALS